jgi:hypothetical protein
MLSGRGGSADCMGLPTFGSASSDGWILIVRDSSDAVFEILNLNVAIEASAISAASNSVKKMYLRISYQIVPAYTAMTTSC